VYSTLIRKCDLCCFIKLNPSFGSYWKALRFINSLVAVQVFHELVMSLA
jgi:hypothetical protein